MMNTEQVDNRSSKRKLLDAEAQWLESLRDEWTPFTVTAVFRSSGNRPRPDRWLDEYKHKVVWKVNKRLCRHARELIVLHELNCRYEFAESSLKKTLSDKRRPHHVHATLLVPKSMANRVWNDEENRLSDRLQKDFKSIRSVSSVMMEPVRRGMFIDWLMYTAKGKPYNQR